MMNGKNDDAETKESYAIHLIIFKRNYFQAAYLLVGLS